MNKNEFITDNIYSLINWISLDMGLISKEEGELIIEDYRKTGNLKNTSHLLGDEKATVLFASLDENKKRFFIKHGFEVQ